MKLINHEPVQGIEKFKKAAQEVQGKILSGQVYTYLF